MYYLIEREQLPEELQGNYFESTPDGRIIISDYTAKVCGKLENVDCYPTKWALDAALKDMQSAEHEGPEADGSKEETETKKDPETENTENNTEDNNEEKDLITT